MRFLKRIKIFQCILAFSLDDRYVEVLQLQIIADTRIDGQKRKYGKERGRKKDELTNILKKTVGILSKP